MADETLRFDIVGDDHVSAPFTRAGRSVGELSGKMDIAARSAKVLDEALKRQSTASRVSVDATLALAKADKILEEAEHGLRDGALEAELALKKEADAARKSGDAAARAAAENRGLAGSLAKIADSAKSKGGPGWLGPALLLAPAAASLGGVAAGAAAGLGGAAVAGGGALAAFAAVAKPVLADAKTAAAAAQKAQNGYNAAIAAGTKQSVAYKAEQLAIAKAYAGMSPAQIALSRQLGTMASAWDKVKAAQTPIVAGALQPWLKSVTGLTGALAPIIAKVAPVIRGLGTQFDGFVNSAAFRGFRDFVANTGSRTVGAAGGTLIDFVKAFTILLPQFNPLISKAVGWIADLGPAVLKWASSKKASDDITRFMAWFAKNGPAVGGFLANIGGALKALAPGLTTGGMTELSLLSGFFGFVAKLPPGLAKPLAEVAGALLLLNKLGVVSVGVKLLGPGAGAAAGAGAAGGLWAKILPGVRLAGGALTAAIVVDMVLKNTSSGAGKNWLDNPFGQGTFKDPKTGKQSGQATGLTSWVQLGKDIVNWWNITWNNTITRTAKGFHDIAGWFDTGRHWIAGSWGQTQHDTTRAWNVTWANTVTRTARGFHDVAGWFDWGRHFMAASFDQTRHSIASTWDTVWNNTVGRTRRGIGDLMGWVGTVPGRVMGVFRGAGSWLVFGGANIINGLWNGIKAVWHGVAGWFGGLPSQILHALGIHSPPAWAIDAGSHIMGGLLKGLAHGASDVKGFFRGIAMNVTGPFKGIWSGLASAGKDVWHALFGGTPGHGNVPANAAAIASYLAAQGFTRTAIAGILGNIQQESGGDPMAGSNPPGRGLIQILGDPGGTLGEELVRTMMYIRANGSVADINAHSSTPTEAAVWFSQVYERPGIPNLPNRIGSAIASFAAGFDQGGWLMPGLTLAYNATGRPERVSPPGGGGATYVINVHASPLARPADIGREVVGAIKAYEHGSGKGWRS